MITTQGMWLGILIRFAIGAPVVVELLLFVIKDYAFKKHSICNSNCLLLNMQHPRKCTYQRHNGRSCQLR